MKMENYNDTVYIKVLEEFPKFWSSIRPNTFSIKNKANVTARNRSSIDLKIT